MSKLTFSSILMLHVFSFCFAQKQELRLPLTFHDSLSSYSEGAAAIQSYKAVSDTCSIAKTCKILKDLQMGEIEIYPMASFNGWDKSYRNSVRVMKGVDNNGKKQIIFDANNNADFSDDLIFVADTMDQKNKIQFDIFNKVKVEYDWAELGKKVKRFLDIHILYEPNKDIYLYTFAHHATTMLNEKKLDIVPQHSLDYLYFELFNHSKYQDDGLNRNRFIVDNEIVYLIKEIDINTNELVLEKQKLPLSKIESAQVGFRPPAFSATDIITKEIVSLEKYKGKYVFLDLFTTWCGPCIKELPEIKKVYDEIDRSKIEFIGIIGEDKPERIANIISKSGLNWRLIEANKENYIFNEYKVSSFPTTLLIDPKGIIIKSGFSSDELKRFIDNGYKW